MSRFKDTSQWSDWLLVARQIARLIMDKTKLSIETLNELLKLRNLLHVVNQQTFSYSVLNKAHPIDTLSEEDAPKILDAYREIISNIKQQVEAV